MFWNFQPSLCRVMGSLCLKTAKDFAERFKQRLPILNNLPFIIKPLANIKSLVKRCGLAYSIRQLTMLIAQLRGNGKRAMNQSIATQCAGFTLLEMLMVIGFLAVVMVTSTSLITDEGAGERQLQLMQNDTQARWHQIRTAIIGDTNLTLSNPSMMHGYVADMGRLPVNIEELRSLGTQPVWTRYDINTVNANVPADTVFLWGGWRGPYLYTAGSQFFRDAWLNESAVALDDAINHGWVVTHLPETVPACTTELDCTDIQVQSLGNDGALGGVDFNADFPVNPPLPAPPLNLVSANEWQNSAASIGFNVILNKAPSQNQEALRLRIYYIENGTVEEEISTPFDHLASVVGITSRPVTISPTPPASTVSLPIGSYVALVACEDDPLVPTDGEVYSGSCAIPPATPPAIPPAVSPYYFTVLPGQALPINIYWNIP
ncbi:type II secretion system protein [Methylotenera sp.]|uniref:type II secretion system protein n=1 Tax=Methylotenera sp. TaxID=2051956 RepID=UPI00273339D0|nr:type II secretion system protein [Methylotenera sp.]MDP3212035.1 type II secretion system protein [Methylotenera sp.]